MFCNSPVSHYSHCKYNLCNVSQVAFSFFETYHLSDVETVFAFPWIMQKTIINRPLPNTNSNFCLRCTEW